MVLVDTSVWVAHLRQTDRRLSALLEEGRVAVHPFVIGELACGRLRNRREILSLLRALPEVPVVSLPELLHYIERRALPACGIGFVDARVVGWAELMGVSLWTLDKPLDAVAGRLRLAYKP